MWANSPDISCLIRECIFGRLFGGEHIAVGLFVQPFTVNRLIIGASKFGDFKILTYWHRLILAVSQFNAL